MEFLLSGLKPQMSPYITNNINQEEMIMIYNQIDIWFVKFFEVMI